MTASSEYFSVRRPRCRSAAGILTRSGLWVCSPRSRAAARVLRENHDMPHSVASGRGYNQPNEASVDENPVPGQRVAGERVVERWITRRRIKPSDGDAE